MKKLNKSFAKIFAVVALLSTSLSSNAVSIYSNDQGLNYPYVASLDLTKNVRRLITLGDQYARLGQIELALEHYSRSIRIGKLNNPNYEDLNTQNKIVALLKQKQSENTELAITQLVWKGDDYAATQPEQALEFYSKSIRMGKLHNDQYENAETQQKIVDLVTILGSSSK